MVWDKGQHGMEGSYYEEKNAGASVHRSRTKLSVWHRIGSLENLVMRWKTFKVSQTKWERKCRNREKTKQYQKWIHGVSTNFVFLNEVKIYRPQALIYTKIGIELHCKSISYKWSLFSR